MNRERFEEVLAAYGADPRRWPDEERAALEAFAAGNLSSADVLAEASALDRVLDLVGAPAAPSPQLAVRILNAAPRKRAVVVTLSVRARWALAACALLGMIAGYGGGRFAPAPAPIAQDNTEEMALSALDAAFGDQAWLGEEG